MPNQTALLLPDSLLVRYFRGGEIELISAVLVLNDGRLEVRVHLDPGDRVDLWRDLGGGLGYVPDAD